MTEPVPSPAVETSVRPAVDSEIAPPPAAGLKPQQRLLVISSLLLAAWIVALVVMYFTTVWPHRTHRVVPPTSPVREQA